MSNLAEHYYLGCASFKNRNGSDDLSQYFVADFCLNKTQLTKAVLADITKSLLEDVKSKNPNMDIYDFTLNSISYLGCMTEEEFNS